jgi:hypothetical protein
MSDFVTRLESELRRAALRQERVGWPRRVALPRLRELGGPAATAVAILSVALVVAVVATVFLRSELERPAGGDVPTELAGTWQLPPGVKVRVGPAPAELRLYPQGAGRCTGLGAGSNPCYEFVKPRGGTLERGTFSVSGAQITFRAMARTHCTDPCFAPGVYSWRVNPGNGSLYLALLGDELRDRARTLSSGPLTRASDPPIPDGWTANRFTSKRYGYSIRYPSGWTALAAASPMPQDALASDTSDTVDKLSPDARGDAGPMVLIAASEIPDGTTLGPEGTTLGYWSGQVRSRVERSGACSDGGGFSASVAGEPAIVTIYPYCNGRQQQWAAFVHDGKGYQVSWWGQPRRQDADQPLFHKILKTLQFHN